MQAVPLDRFGGLNLAENVSEIGLNGAVDIRNVALDYPGRMRSRDGSSLLVSGTSRNFTSLFAARGKILAVDETNHLMRAYDFGGTQLATEAHVTGFGASCVGFQTDIYYAAGGSQQVKKFDPVTNTFSSPAGLSTINGDYLAAQPVEERMVVANADGVSGRIRFSNASAPETFTPADYLDMPGGNTAGITGLAVWDNYLLAFERDRFHIFYGNTTDSTGGSVFSYRTVNSGIGCWLLGAVMTTPSGVYFVGIDGLYRTTGDMPVKVSRPIDPLWQANNLPVPSTYAGTMNPFAVTGSSGVLGHAGTAVFLARDQETYVFDKDQWTVYGIPMAAMAPAADAQVDGSLVYVNNGIRYLTSAQSTDSGTAITGRYRSGFADFGNSNRKRIRETLVDGNGTVSLGWSVDYAAPGTGTSVALGASTAQGRSRTAARGRLVSFQVSGSAAWTVDRLVLHMAGTEDTR